MKWLLRIHVSVRYFGLQHKSETGAEKLLTKMNTDIR